MSEKNYVKKEPREERLSAKKKHEWVGEARKIIMMEDDD